MAARPASMGAGGKGKGVVSELKQPQRFHPVLRAALRVAAVAAVLAFLHFGSETISDWMGAELEPLYGAWGTSVLLLASLLFALLLAIPFVPGMELGLAIMMLFGVRGVVVVYGATLAGLTLSYLAGSRMPRGAVGRLLGWLHLRRAEGFVTKLEGLAPDARMAMLLEGSTGRVVPFLVRHRYLAIALVLNLPGNALIGGGGGIALLAGLSGIFSYPRYLAIVALAILPVPLIFLVKYVYG